MADDIAPGFLVAVPQLGDPNFKQSVVLLLQQSDEGALGIVIAVFLHGLYDYLLSYEHLGLVAIVLLVPLMFTLLGLKIRWARARSSEYHPDLS